MSPGHKILFAMMEDQLLGIDPATGAAKGAIAGGRPITGDIDISPDGTRLVGASDMVVSVYDLQAGKFLCDIGLPIGIRSGEVAALPDHFALVGEALMDLDKCAPVWLYKGSLHPFAAGGRCWSLHITSNRATLVTARIPDESVKRGDNREADSGQFLLKPGDHVALDVSVQATPEWTTKIKQGLQTEIKRLGLTIDPAAPVHIVARTQNGKTFTEHYRSTMGPAFGSDVAVNVTDKISSVSIERDGKPAWVTQTTNRPGMMVFGKAGQSVSEAVTSANQFNIGFLQSARLPNYVLKPTDGADLGKSMWAIGGVKLMK
jgi:hypothetical protein